MTRWDGDNYSVVDQVCGPRRELGPGDHTLTSGVHEYMDRWYDVSIALMVVLKSCCRLTASILSHRSSATRPVLEPNVRQLLPDKSDR